MPPSSDDEVVRTRVSGRVLEVILNRPEARNSLNLALVGQLGTALERLDSDPDLVAGVSVKVGGQALDPSISIIEAKGNSTRSCRS